MKEMIGNNLATQSAIRDLKQEIAALNTDLKRDIEMIKKDLTIRLGGMIVVWCEYP